MNASNTMSETLIERVRTEWEHWVRRENVKMCIWPNGRIEIIDKEYDGVPEDEYYRRVPHPMTIAITCVDHSSHDDDDAADEKIRMQSCRDLGIVTDDECGLCDDLLCHEWDCVEAVINRWAESNLKK